MDHLSRELRVSVDEWIEKEEGDSRNVIKKRRNVDRRKILKQHKNLSRSLSIVLMSPMSSQTINDRLEKTNTSH